VSPAVLYQLRTGDGGLVAEWAPGLGPCDASAREWALRWANHLREPVWLTGGELEHPPEGARVDPITPRGQLASAGGRA
jgi:hypothetical protein